MTLLPGHARGQEAAEPCQRAMAAAEAAYLNQSYERAIALASKCVQQNGSPQARMIQAHRLMTLSYLRQNRLDEARTHVASILSMDSVYVAHPVDDPPSYVVLVSMVRQQKESASRPPSPPRSASVTGVRLTGWDRGFERVNGLNVTVWRPGNAGQHRGRVSGLALGVPVTGASRLHGVGVGLFVDGHKAFHGIGVGGVGLAAGRFGGIALGGLGTIARDGFSGLSLSGLGLRSGGSIQGVSLGSVGAWANGSITGISVGGLGVGARQRIGGVQVGGATVGAGGTIRGLSVGGLGVFSWSGSVYGLQVGSLGISAGRNVGGVTLGVLGARSGGDVTGLTLTGGFIRAGERLRGIQATGIGTFATRVGGITAAPIVAGASGTGLIVAPVYYRGGREGRLTGLSISAFNHVRGEQRGLTIGLLNVARTLHGVQLGLFNFAGNNPHPFRLLPGLNVNL